MHQPTAIGPENHGDAQTIRRTEKLKLVLSYSPGDELAVPDGEERRGSGSGKMKGRRCQRAIPTVSMLRTFHKIERTGSCASQHFS